MPSLQISMSAGDDAQVLSLKASHVISTNCAAGSFGSVSQIDPILGGQNFINTWDVNDTAMQTIGPFQAPQSFVVNCSAGSINVFADESDAGAFHLNAGASVVVPGQLQGIPSYSKKRASSIMFLGDSISAQGSHLPHAPKNRATRDLFPSLPNINSGASGFVITLESHPTTTVGNGTLRYYAADSTMTWQAFGDVEGPRVVISASACMYTLESATAGNTLYIAAIPRLKPTVDKSDTVTVSGSLTLRNNSGTWGHMCWTNALLTDPFDTVLAYAIPTIRASDWWAARAQWASIFTDVTYIMLGTNDGQDLAAVRQAAINMGNIIRARQSIGSTVIVSGLLPWTAGTTAQKAAFMNYNNTLRDIARRLNCDFVDPYQYLVSPASVGDFAAGMSGDGLHPSALGGYVWAKYCNVPALSKYTQATGQRAFAGVVYNATTAPQGNLLLNGVLTGTGGAKPPRGTGDVPDSFTVALEAGAVATVVCTSPSSAVPIPRADGKPGSYFRMVIDNTAGVAGEGYRFRPTTTIVANFAPGDYVVIEGDLRVFGTGVQSLEVGLTVGGTPSSTSGVALSSRQTTGFGSGNLAGDTVMIQFRSAPLLIESGATFLNAYVILLATAGGTATVDLGQTLNLRKVSAP